MNIRYKIRGKAIKFDGTNYQELVDAFDYESFMLRRFGSLEGYIQDAIDRGGEDNPKAAVYNRKVEEWYVVSKNMYFVEFGDHTYTMKEEDFNNNFEEDEQTV